MTSPLVSVITPTWQRHGVLTGRCIPSVAAQTYRPWEQVIVSDGPDPACFEAVRRWCENAAGAGADIRYEELPEHAPGRHWGNPARRRGIEVARGDIIAYLDDDDAYRADHLALLVPALLESGCDFAYSQMMSRLTGETLFGLPRPQMGHIGTPMIVHHRRLLDVATWGADDAMEDWHLVAAWLDAGATYEFVPAATVDVWPSQFHQHA